MIKDEVKVFGPATVSNVGPGFDLMGFALEAPGDEMIIRTDFPDDSRLVMLEAYIQP